MAEHESAAPTVPELTEELLRTLPVPIAAAVHQLKIGLGGERRRAEQAERRQGELRAEAAAANERAEEAEAERDVARTTAAAYLAVLERFADEGEDSLRAQRDEARARLAELRLLRLEWSTTDPAVSRQIYAGPWREGACRSCGTDERVVGDPPLCSNCAVYGGWSSQRPDASLDGLRGPFTGLLGPLGLTADAAQDGRSATETNAARVEVSGVELEFWKGAAGLSEAEALSDCPYPADAPCRHLTCGRCKQHTDNSHQGHYWAYCKATKTKREFHFCCPGDCELEHDKAEQQPEDGDRG